MADEPLKVVAERWLTRHRQEESLELEWSRVRDQLDALSKAKRRDAEILLSSVGANFRTRAYVIDREVVLVVFEGGVSVVKAEAK